MQIIHIALISSASGMLLGAGVFWGALGIVEENYLRWVGLLALFLSVTGIVYVARWAISWS